MMKLYNTRIMKQIDSEEWLYKGCYRKYFKKL